MGAVRKHESFNQHVAEKSERKQLKEEQSRLERMQQIKQGGKQARKSSRSFIDMGTGMDFVALEERIAAYFVNHVKEF